VWPKYVVEFTGKNVLCGDSTNNLWSCIEDCTVYVCLRVHMLVNVPMRNSGKTNRHLVANHWCKIFLHHFSIFISIHWLSMIVNDPLWGNPWRQYSVLSKAWLYKHSWDIFESESSVVLYNMWSLLKHLTGNTDNRNDKKITKNVMW
jgi:hypothetical protein